jgi:hypothetical protein
MPILRELIVALAAIVLLLFISNAFLETDALPTTRVAAAPTHESVFSTPQERINAVFGQFVASKKSRAI